VVTAIEAGATVLATNKLERAILATPALAADNIFIWTKGDLYVFGN